MFQLVVFVIAGRGRALPNQPESRLLYDDSPLIFNPQLAKLIGLDSAILLHQIHYWVKINEKANRNFQDGFFWTYNTFTDWGTHFPFWSVSTIKRIIKNLEDRKLIVSSRFNKLGMDRTKWYRVNHELLISLENPLYQNDTMATAHSVKTGRPLDQVDTMGEAGDSVKLTPTIPETNVQRLTAETNGVPRKIPTLSKVPIFAELQKFLGFPEKTDKDPIPNYGKEGRSIANMKKRNYTEAEILAYWKRRIVAAGGVYVEAWKINEDIGRDRTALGKQSRLLPTEDDLVAQAKERGLN